MKKKKRKKKVSMRKVGDVWMWKRIEDMAREADHFNRVMRMRGMGI